MLRRMFAAMVALLLAAFFLFVGWNKAFASLADLARYHAWTIYIPESLGRFVGWSEMLLAIGLVAGLLPDRHRIVVWAAGLLILNQIIAATIHLAHGEMSALPQNAVLIALLGLVAWRAPAPIKSHTQKETV